MPHTGSGVDPDSGDCFYLTEVSPRDKPWDEHRRTADQVRDLYWAVKFERYAERMSQCSQLLEFALKSSDLGELALKLTLARFCRVRLCPVCQWRRSQMWRARFFKAVPKILADYPTARFLFLTLTVRNCQLTELRDTLSWMNEAWKRLSNRKAFPALGWVKSVEVTRSQDGSAHPHFHVVLMVPPSYFGKGYITKPRWIELWQESLRVDYPPSVDIRVTKNLKGATPEQIGNGLAVALLETLKYSVKEGDLVADENWLAELTRQLHKTRSIAIGGVFKQYISEEEPEDLIDADLENDEPVTDEDPRVWFGWREMVQRYRKTKLDENL